MLPGYWPAEKAARLIEVLERQARAVGAVLVVESTRSRLRPLPRTWAAGSFYRILWLRRSAAGYDCIQPRPGGLAFRCNGMLLPDLQGRGVRDVPLYLPRNADH